MVYMGAGVKNPSVITIRITGANVVFIKLERN